jgi:hypothetical protein
MLECNCERTSLLALVDGEVDRAVFLTLPDEAPPQIAERRKPPAHAASRVRGLLGWICWGDDVDGDLAEGQRDTWSGLHA